MKNRYLKMVIVLLLCTSLVACNGLFSSEENNAENSEPKPEVIPKAVNEFKPIMNQNPGKFSGGKYNEAAVKKELDTFPKNLSDEEYFDRLVYLFAENYQPPYATMQTIDPSIHVNETTPDGKVRIPNLEKFNVQIILDASGSMAGKVSGGQKMDLAKQAIQNFSKSIPKSANVSLRVYGHKGSGSDSDKNVSCQSNEVVYPMSPYHESNFNSALNRFKPMGWTPLASAIQAAKEDMQKHHGENVKNIIYVVSDGIETCGGDPVAAAKSLSQAGGKPVVNIIGFDVDDAGQKQLKEVANAANGQFKSVQSQEDLDNYLENEKNRIEREWRYWGAASRNKVSEIWSEKYKELGKAKDEVYRLEKREEKRIKKAIDYLAGSGIIKDKSGITSLVWDRHLCITSGNWDEFNRVSNLLGKERDAEKERIEKKEEEGASKL
ncbi:vWA domain-containing protein [Hazenella coriacea]|uniref:D-amino-acid dehydrogenase/Ca-activated chloride channel family protein n=1 Tax=Hazenella coriacea TaxID=1179467 RepID=A0A4R3L9U6_9BACL|nr:VWA domain-containing protein [Hazenella coriacea]TCS94256.1 D-amino-acid dehydrogenase/Ca-activated chloride channel family protein [Hazenella coriacea]